MIRLLLCVLVGSILSAQSDLYVDGLLGSDAPSAGGPSTPYRSLSYAVGQLPPFGGPVVIHLEGGQTYSPSTTGEVFPLTMRGGVIVQGEGAAPPTLDGGPFDLLIYDDSNTYAGINLHAG